MKKIISESQETTIYIRRRLDEHWTLIREMVEGTLAMYDPWDSYNQELYLDKICSESTKTYLYHFFDDWRSDEFKDLYHYIIDLINKDMGEEIIKHYIDTIEYDDN